MYLIIDIDYNITKSETITVDIKDRVDRGDISLINIDNLKGQNLDGTWSDINEEGECVSYNNQPP